MSLSRRAWLASLALPAAAQIVNPAPPERRRYLDPSTDGEVIRLTDAAFDSHLPAAPARACDARGRTLLHASLRSGSWQAWLLDLSSGALRTLPECAALHPESLSYSADSRQVLLVDGARLLGVAAGGGKPRELYRFREGCSPAGAIAPTPDATALFFVERFPAACELRRLRLDRTSAETVVEHAAGILDATPNPRRAMVLWRTDSGELWVAAFDGTSKRRVETPPGPVLQARWSPDGQSILYLHQPADASQLNSIREQSLDARADSLVAATSQFVAFAANANASVFAGASRSKASPSVLLLLRRTRRELTLCEHRSTTPALVAPRFAPNSQRVFFESDREGRSALYMVSLERLIESTES